MSVTVVPADMEPAVSAASALDGAVRTVTVTVPATSANLGPGFDTLGLALSIYDTLTVSAFADDRLEIDITGSGAAQIPRDASNLVVRSIAHVYADVGRDMPGLHIRAENGVPHGRGLGSSGAAVTAGILIAKGLLAGDRLVGDALAGDALAGDAPVGDALVGSVLVGDVDLDDRMLLRLATELEGHPDNVAPALFGGLTIAWTGENGPQHKKLLVHRGVAPLVFVPGFTMSTSLARSLQPPQVSREDAVFNVSRSALLVAALTQSPELLLDATADRLHQDYRGAAMPETLRLVQALRAEGHAAVVSGAGPSVLVLADGPGERQRSVDIADAVTDTPWDAHMLAVDVRGGTVRDRAEGST